MTYGEISERLFQLRAEAERFRDQESQARQQADWAARALRNCEAAIGALERALAVKSHVPQPRETTS